jgi:hypothetical protein
VFDVSKNGSVNDVDRIFVVRTQPVDPSKSSATCS